MKMVVMLLFMMVKNGALMVYGQLQKQVLLLVQIVRQLLTQLQSNKLVQVHLTSQLMELHAKELHSI